MKLIVGLGNPGKEYKNTYHNIGFMVLDNYLGKVSFKTKFESKIYTETMFDEEVVFLKPQTYMNLSGIAVQKAAKYYKILPKDILVIQDDLDLSVGTYKIKFNSSSGGHNGLKSIIKELSTEEFYRLKVGIGKDINVSVDKYVLSNISANDLNSISSNYSNFNEIIEMFIKNDINNAMQKYNRKE